MSLSPWMHDSALQWAALGSTKAGNSKSQLEGRSWPPARRLCFVSPACLIWKNGLMFPGYAGRAGCIRNM